MFLSFKADLAMIGTSCR